MSDNWLGKRFIYAGVDHAGSGSEQIAARRLQGWEWKCSGLFDSAHKSSFQFLLLKDRRIVRWTPSGTFSRTQPTGDILQCSVTVSNSDATVVKLIPLIDSISFAYIEFRSPALLTAQLDRRVMSLHNHFFGDTAGFREGRRRLAIDLRRQVFLDLRQFLIKNPGYQCG